MAKISNKTPSVLISCPSRIKFEPAEKSLLNLVWFGLALQLI